MGRRPAAGNTGDTKELEFDITGNPIGAEPRRVTFFAKLQRMAMCVPVFDENGKPVYEKTDDGDFRRDKRGNKMPVRNTITFSTVSNKPSKWLCTFTWVEGEHPEQLLTYLEKLAADPSSPVITKEEFDRSLNPDAYEAKRAAEDKDRTISDLRAKLDAALAQISNQQ